MKTKTLQMTSGLLMVIFWLATITLNAQIYFDGLYSEGEGGAGWDADGSGPEPYGNGHGNVYYYTASRDYVDPAFSSGAHMLDNMTGFPLFEQALTDNGFTAAQVTLKIALADLGEDRMGIDWFTIGDMNYSNFYPLRCTFELDGQSLVVAMGNYAVYISGLNHKEFESCYLKVNNSSGFSPEPVKNVAAALLDDLANAELKFNMQVNYAADLFGNGRSGSYYDVNCTFTKGLPVFPIQGLYADNEGTVAWNADGTGPEPPGDGHGNLLYYSASVDYDGINPDPDACLAHGLEGSDGFQNTLLQLQYRGLNVSDLKLKMGLCSLGPDVEGEDWGWENGLQWLNEYNNKITVEIDGEPILEVLLDTNKMVFIKPYDLIWTTETSIGKVYDISENASQDAQYVAQSFLKDLGSHYLMIDVSNLQYAGDFSDNNGRSGAYYELVAGEITGIHETATFIPEGTVSGIWTADDSPYYVDGNLTIENGNTLTIEPGTRLAFRGPYHIKIEGAVNATGTIEEPIKFTRSNPNLMWDGFDADAVSVENDSSVFDHCIFEYGYGYGDGPYNSGGIFALRDYDKLAVKNAVFRYNVAEIVTTYYPGGGAVALWNCSPLFMNCVFHDNTADFGGAFMAYEDSDPVISNCLFFNNNSNEEAGALLYHTNSDGLLLNCTFVNNFAGDAGGAIECYNHSSPSIINTVFWGDSAAVKGNEINLVVFSHPDFYNCDIYGGKDGIGGSSLVGDFENCIDEDPLFLEMGEYPYQIDFGSPCINAGNADTLGIFLPEYDLAGEIRISGSSIDMGAYEWNETVSVNEITNEMNGFRTYPNPFVTSTTFEFVLEESAPVTIEVYNILGEKVDVIEQSTLPKGKHTIQWSPDNLTIGVYFVLLQAGHTIQTQKILKQ
ncbi:MAG TPA: T9SS type A sorting domain-containing protein [Bacteroidetes bacterium]|nr:T9SS type A sorting domain-containing protein [Bacteroidota bacterium]